MEIPYLKNTPQDSIKKLDELMYEGYRLLDEIEKEYYEAQNNKTYDNHMNIAWKKDIDHWAQKCLNELQTIFIPIRFAYSFKYASSDITTHTSHTSGYELMLMKFRKKIRTITEFSNFIFERSNLTIIQSPNTASGE